MIGQAAIGASSWRLLAETLEARILHSADLSPLGWGGPVAVQSGLAEAAPAKTAVQGTEIAFVDAGLPDASALIADLHAQQVAGRRIEVVTIEAGRDGLALIGQTLAGRSDIAAVHVLAHGSDGRLQLGSAVLDEDSLLQRADELAAWGAALSADADLLLYGCNLAQDADGQRLVQGLAALTGADVAASTDLTGAAARGGNWTLEFSSGAIEAALAPSAWQQAQWQGLLATYTVSLTTDFVGAALAPGTLRWAISQANANPGADRIVFAVNGTFNMPPLTSGGEDNSDGDFDINGSLDIVGNGSGLTVIVGNGVDRVFDVRSGTVTMSGLTVKGGASNNGAGLRISNSAALTLTDAVVESNVGNGVSKGGGIYNGGTLTLHRVTVQNNGNTTSGKIDGAGIYNDSNTTLDARDVAILGNVANDSDGGGIYIMGGNGSAALQNVTLSGNTAKNGGGIFNAHDGTTLLNVTIAGNTAAFDGGGLWSSEGLTLNHVTVAANSSPLGGGVFDAGSNAANAVVAANSLFAGNSGGNTNRALVSQGYNLSSDNSPGFTATGDLKNTAAGVGTLAKNGGSTRTVAITSSSAARDAANPASTRTIDQRGMATFGGRADIGAYEYNPAGFAPTIAGLSNQSILEDRALSARPFTISDAETSAGSLTVTATSNNTALVPSSNITLGGSGADRTISLTPVANANSTANGGAARITVTVSDGGNSTSLSFDVVAVAQNDASTGSVTIAGTPTQGQTLTASNTLADVDGLGAIVYQWRADGIAIGGATGSTLVLGQAQVGKIISVTATYTDFGGTAESVTSAATAAVANLNSAPTGSVSIAGTPTQGQTLTASNTLADADGLGAISYQWRTDGTAIGGATGSTLVLTQSQVGKTISVTASYTDGFGTAESVTGTTAAPVANLNDAPTGSLAINGTPTLGATLTFTDTLADADGLGPIGYQWAANGVDIASATGASLVLGPAQVGTTITLRASYTDGLGASESVTSAPTSLVTASDNAPTGNVTIAGMPTQGQTLTASNTLADADGLGAISYQWSADGIPIGGATMGTLLLGQAQVGKFITVLASYIDGGGTAESVSSATTAAVANVNDGPTGSVTIAGTPTQGQTLTASNTVADVDGPATLVISYQWRADGTPIGGATGSTLLLAQAQVGKAISVTASYTDGFGAAENVTSLATAAVANVNDNPTGGVTIAGTPTEGLTLTASNTLADADGLGAISYQWSADGIAIGGATASTLLLAQGQVGRAISVTASYTDGFGAAEGVTSPATAAVANANDAPTGSVSLAGTPTQGQTLTASNTLADADGLGAISYQWMANGVAISGATGSTLLLSQAQVGQAISVTASYTDGFGTPESVTSAATAAVANANDAPTGSVSLAGRPTQGQTLTASNTLADVDGLGAIAYQWQADGVAISGATGGTFVLGQAEIGKAISVTASYTDALGTAESVSSDATAPVAAANRAPVLAQAPADQPAVQGSTLQFALPPTTFTDADAGDTLSFVATLTDGSTLPQWISFNGAQQVFVVSAPLGRDAGPVWVRVVASDAAGASAQLVFAIVVVPQPVETIVPAVPTAPAPAPAAAPAPVIETSVDKPTQTAPTEPEAAASVQDDTPATVAFTQLLAVAPESPERRVAPAAAAGAAETPTARPASRADAVLAAEPVLQYSDLAGAQLLQLLKGDDMLRRLDELKRQMTESSEAHRNNVMASSVVMTTGISVGYVVWLVRGGVLMSSMLSALPAWQLIDPMPVLAASGAFARQRMPAPGEEREVERFFGKTSQESAPARAVTTAATSPTGPAATAPDAASLATHAAEHRP